MKEKKIQNPFVSSKYCCTFATEMTNTLMTICHNQIDKKSKIVWHKTCKYIIEQI